VFGAWDRRMILVYGISAIDMPVPRTLGADGLAGDLCDVAADPGNC
jgi:hypothetical protein